MVSDRLTSFILICIFAWEDQGTGCVLFLGDLQWQASLELSLDQTSQTNICRNRANETYTGHQFTGNTGILSLGTFLVLVSVCVGVNK